MSSIQDTAAPAVRHQTAAGTGQTLHARFADTARLQPDRIALVADGRHVSYAVLDRRSTRLAQRLVERGVGLESIVAISATRSVDVMVGILAIVKAGAAYLPLDPTYPRDRLQYMLADAGARLVLTGGAQRGIFGALGVDEMPLSGAPSADDGPPARPLPRVAAPDTLAYVIYTSGSTGRPKGIMVLHQAVLNHVDWRVATFGITADDRLLQRTPISFDISVWEIFGALLTGCTLVLPPVGGPTEVPCLVDTIVEDEVTTLEIVPSILKLLLQDPQFRDCRSLRYVFAGGEALPADVAARSVSTLGATLVNVYGPTETTIWSTSWTCPREAVTRVPIGHPIWNTDAHILQTPTRPSRAGEEGLLFLGGLGLARGYWRRPDLTAAAFVPHPLLTDEAPGARMYNTGDLARMASDGTIEFLGRRDGQVKLRGFRIELQEIERAVKACPLVADALVMIRTQPGGDRKIVCYYVLRAHENTVAVNAFRHTRAGEIREAVARQLPEYMVPQHFRSLDAIPLLPNGKVHVKALPEPAYELPLDHHSEPRNETERLLAQVWSEVLGVPTVGCNVKFSWYGGDSLQMVEVRLRAHQRGLLVRPGAMHQYATVRSLAAISVPLTDRGATRRIRLGEVGRFLGSYARVTGCALRDVVRQWRTRRLERPDRARFEAFYAALPNKQQIFYLFVRRGLLHWMAKQLEFIPEDVNLVIIAAAPTADEQAWIARHVARPCFHTALDVDDNTAWEMLFETNQHNFGWIEIGCFVINSALFRELARIDADVAFNTTYVHTERHRRMFLEYLLFVNVAAIRAVAARQIPVHPSRYSSRGDVRPEHRAAYHRVPRGRDRATVRKLLRDASGPEGPRTLAGWLASERLFNLYFYMGHLFYLHAQQLGYRIHRVRNLTDPTDVNGYHNFFSDEVISGLHVSRYEATYGRSAKFDHDLAMMLQADYALLRSMVSRLPAAYAARLADLEAKIQQRGMRPQDAARHAREHLIEYSVSPQVFDAPQWRFLDDSAG